MAKSYDVIVAGAGPVGLFLACELGLVGISVLVLERNVDDDSPWKRPPLDRRGINTQSIESFYRRGLIDKVLEGSEKLPLFQKTSNFSFAGHFAGIAFDGNKIDFSKWKYHLPRPMQLAPTRLLHVESVLAKRATELGVHILRGKEVTQVVDQGDAVRVTTEDDSYTGSYLVGCDGGKSCVRRLAGFEFVGTEAEFIGYVVSCDLDKPELLKPGFNHTDRGMYIQMNANNVYLMDFDMSFDRTKDITKEHIQDVIRRVTGTDITVNTLHVAGSFTDRAKQVTEYQRGRILLAGDSAHIHSPLGAQGLNAGLGDAMNLGWKLAATVKGRAAPGLLATYHKERHPVAAEVLNWTRAQTALLRPDAAAQALYKIMSEAMGAGAADYYLGRMWGLALRYDIGGEHDIVGRSVPDFEMDDDSRLGSKLQTACFQVIDFAQSEALKDFVRSLHPQLEYYTTHTTHNFDLKALIVRPDGVVAWATTDEVDVQAVKKALSKWLNWQ